MHLPDGEAARLATDIHDAGMRVVLPPAPGTPIALDG